MRNDNSYLLRTYCATFNHENYILDALKGFAMQQTTFPVVYTIVDDASTDGTAAVIKKFVSENFSLDADSVGYEKDLDYGHVTFARHKTNKNCFFAVIYLKENHFSQKKPKAPYLKEWMDTKYLALCEGDDYWIDPLKLQKQVDFLEEHSEYDMVCTRFVHLYETNQELVDSDLYDGLMCKDLDGMELIQEHFLYSALPHPCTVMYRNGTLTDNPVIKQLKYTFDIPLYWCFMDKHRVWLMNEKMSVYRKHGGSITSCGVSEQWDIYMSYVDLIQYFPNNAVLRKLCAASYRTWRVIPAASDDKYGLFSFFHDMKVYLRYKPNAYNVLTLTIRVIEVKIRKMMKRFNVKAKD